MTVIFEFQHVCSWKEFHQSQGSKGWQTHGNGFIWLVPSTHCSKSLVSDKAAHQKVSVIYIKLFTGTKADIKRVSSERVKQSTLHVGVKICLSLHLHTGTISALLSFNTSESYFQKSCLQLLLFLFLALF